MKKMHGQNLVELTACLLIGSLVLTLAIPAFTSARQHNQQAQAVNQLLGALQYARSEAIMSRGTTALCSGAPLCGATITWRNQLLIFSDSNRNGQLDSSEALLQQLVLPRGYDWHWSNFRSRPYLQFEADGTTYALNGTLTLCHEGRPTRQIVINSTGRTRTQAASADASCS